LSEIHPGEIWRIKEEIGFRYVLVISPTSMNQALESIVTIPITTKKKSWPTRMAITFKKSQRYLMGEQIVSSAREKFELRIGELSLPEMAKLRVLLKQMLVD
tara:strand:+ start:99133 stop:99438 length:306 start_codon:yes stop_codon:yes gene_type:complete